MEDDRSMRVGHPLRLSRCPGGIAQRGRIVLLQIRIDRSIEVVTQQGFVVLQSCGHGLAAERNHEDTLKLTLSLNFSKSCKSTSSTIRKRSWAWLMMYASSSGWSRRFRVCSTPPAQGTPK